MAEPERRRRRPAISCLLCRRRKIRCNRETPCSNCVRSSNAACVYTNLSQPARVEPARLILASKPHGSVPTDQASITSRTSKISSNPPKSVSTVAAAEDGHNVESIRLRIRRLEEQLIEAVTSSTHSPAPTSNSYRSATTCGTVEVVQVSGLKSDLFGDADVISRSVMRKSRLFGQTHWINDVLLFRDTFELIEAHRCQETSHIFSKVHKCKSLAKVIKMRRTPPWPSIQSSDLPSKMITDALVDCYLRTTESVYRILHIPTFKRDYEMLWKLDAAPDPAFIMQVKLVLAIGAATFDTQFSLRPSVIQWIYEAQSYLSEPESKSRFSIQSLQTNLLLLLARETAGVGGSLVWVSAGDLLRTAVYMGLHRDPTYLPQRTTLASEMRRRLWNTILEISLQSSMTSGGPPLLSLGDFDCEPPGNFDDENLLSDVCVAKPETEFTQMSVAIALRKTFSLRLQISKFLNNLGPQGTYEDALRLDSEFKSAYKSLCRTLHSFASKFGPSPSQFQIRVVDFIIMRYLSSLHVPFFGPSLHNTVYAYSRNVAVETSLKLWHAAYPSSSSIMAQSSAAPTQPGQDDFARLTTRGSGFFRSVAIQAAFIIMVDLKTQLQEDEGLSPAALRPDLLSVVEDSKIWNLQGIQAGETNVKAFFVMSVIAAHVEGLRRGVGKDRMGDVLARAAEDALDVCLPILEENAGLVGADDNMEHMRQMDTSTLPEFEGWNFLVSTDELWRECPPNGLADVGPPLQFGRHRTMALQR
ncbi:putative Zn(II)2Cys6 transcription factor [Melanomma pulvis-pyrius CBS 109.77]|uniref:Putative Zn(II)2Cys6 transcription factor n=1 Tax=Melanomma pulvis-pyrius CBS 109.77 TaxID=1314802 RepID=A0A6A6XLS6_9PLEO|nr:putative Zn(II)2Cys6 transcription factor [Melanomma pulvis-pyrius CBS 109.77]